MNTKSWNKISVTLIFVIKRSREVLLGQILGGTIAGFVTPPGGKVEKSDKNIKDAAARELAEETNLKARQIHQVAEVRIRISGKRKTVILNVFVCKSWSGRLRRESREFSYLKWFNISRIPYHKMAPGDEEWVRRILRGERLDVDVICHNDRCDLREIKIKILP